jgi:hypothetical protein
VKRNQRRALNPPGRKTVSFPNLGFVETRDCGRGKSRYSDSGKNLDENPEIPRPSNSREKKAHHGETIEREERGDQKRRKRDTDTKKCRRSEKVAKVKIDRESET